LSSACTVFRNLPDDREELTVLRGFRENYMRNMEGGKALTDRRVPTQPSFGLVGKSSPVSRLILHRRVKL
jgi:hypothetical protein